MIWKFNDFIKKSFSMYWKQPLQRSFCLKNCKLRDSTTAATQRNKRIPHLKMVQWYSEMEINPTVVRMIGQVWFSRSSMLVSRESGELSFARVPWSKKPANCLKDVLADDFVSLQPSEFSGGVVGTGKQLRQLLLRLPPESFCRTSYILSVHISLK